MKTDLQGNIAYGNGRTGDIIHVDCWGAYVDARTRYDAQGRPYPLAMIGTQYFPAALKKELKNKLCAHCKKPFTSAVNPAHEGTQ